MGEKFFAWSSLTGFCFTDKAQHLGPIVFILSAKVTEDIHQVGLWYLGEAILTLSLSHLLRRHSENDQ